MPPNPKTSTMQSISSENTHHLANQKWIKNPLKQTGYMADRVQITYHPPILPPTNIMNPSISCSSCKLAHMQYCSDCPQTLGTIQIRILLDELRKTAKGHPLYNQLRGVLAIRSDPRARTWWSLAVWNSLYRKYSIDSSTLTVDLYTSWTTSKECRVSYKTQFAK
jgi:hypothetical protein